MKRGLKEKKEFRVRNSRKLYIPFYLMIFVLGGILIYIQSTGRPLNDLAYKIALAFIAAIIISTEIHRLGNLYEISEKSIIHTQGYFSTISKRVEFGAISDIDVIQGPWQRIIKFGHIQLFKFAEGPILKNINNPRAFADRLERKMVETRRS